MASALSRYATISLKSLALWRIALGASCVQLVLRRWGTLDVFYTETGAYPAAALGRGITWEAGPLRWVSSPSTLHVIFALSLAISAAFCAGLGTRYVKWLLLPVLFTLHRRTPMLFTGGEAVLHSQAIYAALLPVGAVLSADSWLAKRRHPETVVASPPTAISSLVYPLILLQLAVIYFFNTRSKMGESWHNGQAVAEALGAATLATDFGAWVRHLPPTLLHGLTYGTLAIEGILPLLLLSPWARRWTHALAGGLMLALHGGIYLTLDVGSFSASMLSYLPLLWHARFSENTVVRRSSRGRWLEALVVLSLLYVGAARLSRDLILWPERPRLPMPAILDKATFALGLMQAWMMFSPHPPERDFIIVTDAVTQKGLHFDPWREVASGYSQPLKELPQSVVREHVFTRYENYLSYSETSALHPYFARWVLAQRGADGAPVERFDAWLMMISTDPARLVPAAELDARVGLTALPIEDALPISHFDATGIWAPERALDRKIVPEGTHVFTPVGAVMSAGCPLLTLDLGQPHTLRSAFLQADTVDYFALEGSLDGKEFRSLAEMPRVEGSHFKSRLISLPGEAVRFVRVRPMQPRGYRHFLSEIALFEHPVVLPPLTSRPSEEFLSALARPGIAGIVSASSHPTTECPAEDVAAIAASRGQ